MEQEYCTLTKSDIEKLCCILPQGLCIQQSCAELEPVDKATRHCGCIVYMWGTMAQFIINRNVILFYFM